MKTGPPPISRIKVTIEAARSKLKNNTHRFDAYPFFIRERKWQESQGFKWVFVNDDNGFCQIVPIFSFAIRTAILRFKLFREWLNQNRWKLGNSTGWERTWPIPRSQWEIKQSTRFGGISFEFWWFTIGNSNQFRRLLNWRWWSCGRACSTPSGCQISLLYKRHWLLFLATLLTLTFPFILGFWLPNGLFILVVHFLLLEDDGPWVEWVRSFPDW